MLKLSWPASRATLCKLERRSNRLTEFMDLWRDNESFSSQHRSFTERLCSASEAGRTVLRQRLAQSACSDGPNARGLSYNDMPPFSMKTDC